MTFFISDKREEYNLFSFFLIKSIKDFDAFFKGDPNSLVFIVLAGQALLFFEKKQSKKHYQNKLVNQFFKEIRTTE